MAELSEGQAFKVFCGVDVAQERTTRLRSIPWAAGWSTVHYPTTRPRCAPCSKELTGHGPVLVVVDQPASTRALAIAVARSMGIEVGYLPG